MGTTYTLADLLEEKMPATAGLSHAEIATVSTAISLKRIADSLDKIRDDVEMYAALKG